MDYEKFCSKIIDSKSKIRFASVYDPWAKRVAGGLRPGVENLLSDSAQNELVNLAVLNWKARKDMSKLLGKTIYTLAEHDTIKRFSFYLGDDHMLLVSSDKAADTNVVVDEVQRHRDHRQPALLDRNVVDETELVDVHRDLRIVDRGELFDDLR